MHPEIVQHGPGACPICGMDLVRLRREAAATQTEFTSRWLPTLLLLLPLMAFMLPHFFPGPSQWRWIHSQGALWIQAILATPVFLWSAWPIHRRAIESIQNRSPNMFTLLSLGITAAYLASVGVLLGWLQGGIYFETTAMITLLAIVGQIMEEKALGRAGESVAKLLSLMPERAAVIHNDEEILTPVADLREGDLVRIRPGDKLPADGAIESGHGALNESLLSGEAMPQTKAPGDEVASGSINTDGTFIFRISRTGDASTLGQIVAMVNDARRSRPPIQKLADKTAAVFVPTVLLIALATLLLWAGSAGGWTAAISHAVAVLVIACPCALGLATPVSISVAVGTAAQNGIILRSADAIERLARVDTIAFDKTGTLTQGKPRVMSIEAAMDEGALLAAAGAIAATSNHPLSRAIADAAKGHASIEAVEPLTTPGGGIEARVDGRMVLLGSIEFLASKGVATKKLQKWSSESAEATLVAVAIDGAPAGVFLLNDPPKTESAEAVRVLKKMGIECIVLSGDRPEVVRKTAEALGIGDFHGSLLPDGKARIMRHLRDRGREAAMAGDGINDAPALAEASVGIAMGGGADLAKQSATVVLPHGNLDSIVRAVRIARATVRNIRQNLVFAFGYNALGIPLAAGLFGWSLDPMFAAAAMTLSSLCVVGNALRLGMWKAGG